MKTETKAHDDFICGAKTRAGTPCKQKAGWGTNHVGEGRCKLHGGKSTGPKDKVKLSKDMKGNKKAVTTHEYESIIFDFLDEEEKSLLKKINLDKLIQLDNEIRLIDIRLRRMMGRIAKLQKEDLSTVEVSVKNGPMGHELMEKKQGTLGQIQNIEEAITRVQAQKLRLIKAKHDIEISTDLGEIYEDDGFIEAMTGQVDEVWDDHEDY